METESAGLILCTLRFYNKRQNRSLVAEIHHPQPFVTHPKGAPAPVKDWGCRVLINLDGVQQVRTVYSVSWPSSFLLALEFVRLTIPTGEERDWIDEVGVESWCILPHSIPFSWGYPLYSKIARVSDEMEREYEAAVERRRLAWEERRKNTDR